MAGTTSKEETSRKAIVADTNILISAMLKETGYTRRTLILLTELYPTYTPTIALQEIREHAAYIAEKKKTPKENLEALIKIVTWKIQLANPHYYQDKTEQARKLVRDPGDIDFAALALKLAEKHDEVILLTWNKRDYKIPELEELKVKVLSPPEAAKTLLPLQI